MATDGCAALTTERTVVASPLPPQHPWPGGETGTDSGPPSDRGVHRDDCICSDHSHRHPTSCPSGGGTHPGGSLRPPPAVPVGVYFPCLNVGAGYGRLCGEYLRRSGWPATEVCAARPPPPGAEYLSSFALLFLWGMLCFGECGFIYLLCRVQHQFAAVQFFYEFLPVAVICQFSDLLGIHSTGVFNFCDPTSLFVFFTTSEIQNEVCES